MRSRKNKVDEGAKFEAVKYDSINTRRNDETNQTKSSARLTESATFPVGLSNEDREMRDREIESEVFVTFCCHEISRKFRSSLLSASSLLLKLVPSDTCAMSKAFKKHRQRTLRSRFFMDGFYECLLQGSL